MAKVKDPVCGMEIEGEAAAGESTAGGNTYFFCSTQCQHKFNANSDEYIVASAGSVGHADSGETLERNLTKKGGMTAPRFGSAGSGGLEFEGPPGTSRAK